MKLAIITTHPIQYYAPVFKLLTERKNIQVKVFYTWGVGYSEFDQKFGRKVDWDIPLCEGYEHEFVENSRNNKHGFFDVRNPGLNKIILKWGANFILVYGWNYASHLKAMLFFKGKLPVLFRGDSTLLDEKGRFRVVARRKFLQWIYKSIDYALYVGTENKRYFIKHGLKEEQLVFAPHAVDNSRFMAEDSDTMSVVKKLKEQFNITEDNVVFLYAGKFYEVKNLLTLISSFKRFQNKSAKLILFGNGAQEVKIREDATNDPRIIISGFRNQSEMPAIYRLADVFVLPSTSETWGLAVNEAMACERAVLVSDKVGCSSDLVKPGVNGYVFPVGNIDSLVSYFETLSDRLTVKQLCQNSKKIIDDWSFINQVEAIEGLILKI